MEIPMIEFSDLEGQKKDKTMVLLHQACEKWGFFQVENHGIDKKLMEKVKQLVNSHYEDNLKENFYESEMAKRLNNKDNLNDTDWESSFFIWHHPKSNINEITNLI
ncbi:1-aminocyclopropane-1-carboxylate oxidase 1-like [Pistacia vera]|uniref:1-aminocyclopropane-1-carboxylate oxidase 1-like n=1 Tax=Pistacia vera TaxID=55513 RepID=UPI0012635A2E|nr:1-aminocyclopropane-1-carboxylate oxidase 1-like [Pistacia vera]